MSKRKKSIVITFSADDPMISSDLAFLQKLSDLRERYPSWHVRGIVHSDDKPSFIPQKPSASTTVASSATALFLEEESKKNLHEVGQGVTMDQSEADYDDEDDMSFKSDHSDGNVIGEHPRTLQKGLIVRMSTPPYADATGYVSEVKGERFKVTFFEDDELTRVGSKSWWCVAEDVVVVAINRDSLPTSHCAARDSLQRSHPMVEDRGLEQQNKELRQRVRELESELSRMRKLLFDSMEDDGPRDSSRRPAH